MIQIFSATCSELCSCFLLISVCFCYVFLVRCFSSSQHYQQHHQHHNRSQSRSIHSNRFGLISALAVAAGGALTIATCDTKAIPSEIAEKRVDYDQVRKDIAALIESNADYDDGSCNNTNTT